MSDHQRQADPREELVERLFESTLHGLEVMNVYLGDVLGLGRRPRLRGGMGRHRHRPRLPAGHGRRLRRRRVLDRAGARARRGRRPHRPRQVPRPRRHRPPGQVDAEGSYDLAEQPSAATGTVIRPPTMRHYATEAGFARVSVLDQFDHDAYHFYRLDP